MKIESERPKKYRRTAKITFNPMQTQAYTTTTIVNGNTSDDNYAYLAKTPEGKTIFPDLDYTGIGDILLRLIAQEVVITNISFRLTCKTLLNAIALPVVSKRDLVIDAATSGYIDMYNILSAGCTIPRFNMKAPNGMSFRVYSVDMLLGIRAPIDDLVDGVARGVIATDAIDVAIMYHRDAADLERLIDALPEESLSSSTRDFVITAMYAGNAAALRLFAARRQLTLRYVGASVPPEIRAVAIEVLFDCLRTLGKNGGCADAIRWLADNVHGIDSGIKRLTELYPDWETRDGPAVSA